MSEGIADHPIHVPAIRGPLTKNLGVVFGDVVDEINEAFADSIDRNLNGDGELVLGHYNAELTDDMFCIRMVGRECIDDHGHHHFAR